MKILLCTLSVFLFLSYAYALPDTAANIDLCVCQTGDAPVNQIKFFTIGCKTWLNSHSCNAKETTDVKTSLGEIIQRHNAAKRIKIGYVGHWASASETVNYLKNKVTADIGKFDLQFVDIDNTACLSNDNPYDILKYFKKIGRDTAAKINVRGNQVNSAGMWDSVLPGKANFWAVANGENMQAIFPNCTEFRGRNCYSNFQAGDTGVCYNSDAKKYEHLTCLKKRLHHEWQTQVQFNLEITKHIDKFLNKVTLGFDRLNTSDVTVLYISDAAVNFSSAQAHALLLPQIPLPRFNQLTALAKIYGLPLSPIVKSHEQSFMSEIYTVSEKSSEYIQQVFETEEEANIYIAKSKQDPRFQLIFASQQD